MPTPPRGSVPTFKDGFRSRIFFQSTDVVIWEKELNPPGVDGGGGIPQDTMVNDEVRTMWPKQLKTITPITVTAAYGQVSPRSLYNAVNRNQLIEFTYPNGSTVSFYGFINKVTPNQNKEGEQPTLQIEIIPTNVNPVPQSGGFYMESRPAFTTVGAEA